MRLKQLVDIVKTSLRLKYAKVVGDLKNEISQIAICTGSGAFLIPFLADTQNTCLITGDIKYHDAQLAYEKKLSVIDAGHFETEIIFAQTMKKLFNKAIIRKNNLSIRTVTISGQKNPIRTI